MNRHTLKFKEKVCLNGKCINYLKFYFVPQNVTGFKLKILPIAGESWNIVVGNI